jgi:DNA gyrase subunit A
MLVSSSGKTIRFAEADVRPMGRTARGVRGIKMAEGFAMIALIIPEPEQYILSVSENGYGKRTQTAEFPVYGRGGQGVIGIQTSDRNGAVVGAVQVTDSDEIMLISDKGTLVRTRIDEVSVQGRNTQGVRMIRLKQGEKLVGLERVEEPDESIEVQDESASPITEAPANTSAVDANSGRDQDSAYDNGADEGTPE